MAIVSSSDMPRCWRWNVPKIVQISLVVQDDRAADLKEAISTVLQFAKMDGDIPDHEVGEVRIKNVSAKVMSNLTTEQREGLGLHG